MVSPLTVLVISPAKGATAEHVGVTRMRAVWNSSTRRRFMRWKRSKTCSICSAGRLLRQRRTKWRSTGWTSSQRGWPSRGRRVRRVQAAVKVRKSPAGSASKTESSTVTSAPSDSSTPDRAVAGGRDLGVHRGVAERGRVGDADGHVGIVEGGQPRRLGAGSARRSVGSGPTATSRARATSAMRRAIGPLVERSSQPGGVGPPPGTRPRLGFMPESPQHAEGMRMEPPPSDPVASGTMPAASAAAAPPEDPPGPRLRVERVQRGAEDRRWSCCP